jgi:hypothetical protein
MAGERIPATKNCVQKTYVANPTPNCIVNSLLDLLLGPQLLITYRPNQSQQPFHIYPLEHCYKMIKTKYNLLKYSMLQMVAYMHMGP